MKLKNITITGTSKDTDPFDGIILYSNSKLKNTNEFELDEIITKDIQGVIFKGDWRKRILDFTECLKKISEYELEMFLDIDISLEEFKLLMGIASFNKVRGTDIKRKELEEKDIPMLVFTGAVLLDYYLRHTRYHVYSMELGGKKLNVFELPKEELDNDSKDSE